MIYFLYYFSAGLIIPLWYANMMKENFAILLGIISVLGAISSLYIGKLAEKIKPEKLLLIGIPIMGISVFFLQEPFIQILFGVISVINNLLIVVLFSKIGKSGISLGRLNFFAQLAFASTLFIGAFIQSYVLISIILLFILFTALLISVFRNS